MDRITAGLGEGGCSVLDVKFEVPVRHPRGNNQLSIDSQTLKFRGVVWARERNLKDIENHMLG